MQEKAKVLSLDGKIATVVPLDIETCMGCTNSDCKKDGSIFKAINSKNLELYPGAEVRIMAHAKHQLLQGFFSIGVPLFTAALAWLIVAKVSPQANEALFIGVSFAALLLSAWIVSKIRKASEDDLPEIYELVGTTQDPDRLMSELEV